MGVHERRYRPYDGPTTASAWRFLVVPRYAFREVLATRSFLAVFVASFFWPLACIGYIYLRHNANALAILQIPLEGLSAIDVTFFFTFLRVQVWFAFVLTFLTGPGLVAADFRNNALPLYLSRPFSRAEYVGGKLVVLVALMSAVTWIPGLLLFALEAGLEGRAFLAANGWIAGSLFVASWVTILGIALPALAISAWVKWKPLAAAGLLAAALVPSAIGATINSLLHTWRGSLLSIAEVLLSIWAGLFRQPASVDLPLGSAWTALAVILSLCLLTLWRRVRAYEVAR